MRIQLSTYILAVLLFPAMLAAQRSTEAEAITALLREAAAASIQHCNGKQVALLIEPATVPSFVAQTFAEALQTAGRGVLTSKTGSECILRVDIRDMYSSTAQSLNSSYFRTTQLTAGVLVEDVRQQRLNWSREFSLSRTDTLDGTAPFDEHNWMTEEPSWWEALFQPALVTLTAAVIVLLLFTVRGSP